MNEPVPLFDIRPGPIGSVETAARTTITAAITAGRVDPDTDALLIAHLTALAAAVDRCTGRVDPRAMTVLSRELRAVAGDLGLTREPVPPAAPAAGPFDFLSASDAESHPVLAP